MIVSQQVTDQPHISAVAIEPIALIKDMHLCHILLTQTRADFPAGRRRVNCIHSMNNAAAKTIPKTFFAQFKQLFFIEPMIKLQKRLNEAKRILFFSALHIGGLSDAVHIKLFRCKRNSFRCCHAAVGKEQISAVSQFRKMQIVLYKQLPSVRPCERRWTCYLKNRVGTVVN